MNLDTCVTCGCELGDELGESFFDDDGDEIFEGPFCESCYMKHAKEVRERCKDQKTS